MTTEDRIAIAIPTYNEKENIRKLAVTLVDMYPSARLFIVDDNSPDGTAEVVQELAYTYPAIRLIWREHKQGAASACLDAFARILPDETFDYIVTMNGDLSHNPADLKILFAAAATNDIVIGSRYIDGGGIENQSWLRRVLSKWGQGYARVVTGLPIEDLTSGYVIYHRDILGRILMQLVRTEGYAHQIEMKYLGHKFGARIKELPITFRAHHEGSKADFRMLWEGLKMPLYLRLFD
jgi:dolichol-phosphate mannosyltransferase